MTSKPGGMTGCRSRLHSLDHCGDLLKIMHPDTRCKTIQNQNSSSKVKTMKQSAPELAKSMPTLSSIKSMQYEHV